MIHRRPHVSGVVGGGGGGGVWRDSFGGSGVCCADSADWSGNWLNVGVTVFMQLLYT